MRVIVVAVDDGSGTRGADDTQGLVQSLVTAVAASMSASSGEPDSEANGHRLARLTPRELEVLRLMARGLGNGEIARRLFISEKTVKVHVSHIFEKLRVGTRVQAVLAAASDGAERGLRSIASDSTSV